MGAKRGAYWVGRPEGQRQLPRLGWEDNIKVDVQEVKWGGLDWIDLDQYWDRWRTLVNTLKNLRVP
jgi:hypothetical protein